jgi:YVTN family beta-propeller protein
VSGNRTWLVGAYTADMGGGATGIAELSATAGGSLELVRMAAVADSPSYLAADGNRLYAASEAAGRIDVFSRTSDGRLDPIGSAPSGGVEPCQLTVAGNRLLVSNYGSGTIGVIDTDTLELIQVLEGSGSGPHAVQDGPHAHATFLADADTALSVDLGADEVHVHRITASGLSRAQTLALPGGTGPRDLVRHPSGAILLLAELSLELLVLDYAGGSLSVVDSFALPGAEAGDHAAGISLTDDARFAFVALRGSNRIASLALSADGRAAVPVATVPSGGEWPRHHAVDGDVLHVANQISNSVTSLRIAKTGELSLISPPTFVPSPTFLLRG